MKVSDLEPWKQSAHTIIWDILEACNKLAPADPARFTGVGSWIIRAPWMHLAWKDHYVGICHLRDVPAMPPAKIILPGATHEMSVFALNPDQEPNILSLRILTPISIAQQFTAKSDADAVNMIQQLFLYVLDGKLSVDSDYRSTWRHMLTECPERPVTPNN